MCVYIYIYICIYSCPNTIAPILGDHTSTPMDASLSRLRPRVLKSLLQLSSLYDCLPKELLFFGPPSKTARAKLLAEESLTDGVSLEKTLPWPCDLPMEICTLSVQFRGCCDWHGNGSAGFAIVQVSGLQSYEIYHCLGCGWAVSARAPARGSFGEVYLGLWIGATVAVKILAWPSSPFLSLSLFSSLSLSFSLFLFLSFFSSFLLSFFRWPFPSLSLSLWSPSLPRSLPYLICTACLSRWSALASLSCARGEENNKDLSAALETESSISKRRVG